MANKEYIDNNEFSIADYMDDADAILPLEETEQEIIRHDWSDYTSGALKTPVNEKLRLVVDGDKMENGEENRKIKQPKNGTEKKCKIRRIPVRQKSTSQLSEEHEKLSL